MTEVLIAQLGTPSRWNQFSPHFETVTEYFGAQPHEHFDIEMRGISGSGALQARECRTSIPKDSSNWSFEIGEAIGLAYPATGERPTVVFLRRQDGSYVYRLLMPGDQDYAPISQHVITQYNGPCSSNPSGDHDRAGFAGAMAKLPAFGITGLRRRPKAPQHWLRFRSSVLKYLVCCV